MKKRAYLILLVLICIVSQVFIGCNDQNNDSTSVNLDCEMHSVYSLEEFYEDLITLNNGGQINDAIGSTDAWKYNILHSDGTLCSKIELLVPIVNPDKFVFRNVCPMGTEILYQYDLIGTQADSAPIIIFVSKSADSDIEEAPAEYDEKEKWWKLVAKNYDIEIVSAGVPNFIKQPSDITENITFEYKVLQECEICKTDN